MKINKLFSLLISLWLFHALFFPSSMAQGREGRLSSKQICQDEEMTESQTCIKIEKGSFPHHRNSIPLGEVRYVKCCRISLLYLLLTILSYSFEPYNWLHADNQLNKDLSPVVWLIVSWVSINISTFLQPSSMIYEMNAYISEVCSWLLMAWSANFLVRPFVSRMRRDARYNFLMSGYALAYPLVIIYLQELSVFYVSLYSKENYVGIYNHPMQFVESYVNWALVTTMPFFCLSLAG